ncbi:MAG: aldehyde dehydrogenase family protein [Verrucomicrobia bacterium]|nr:MAG: aldehyde dehydrogenase family protein [Verrucomicrobiota bacterium]
MTRIPVSKTPKVYVGGAFIRSESGRVYPLHDAKGRFVANIPQCTRKDVRNAVEAAAKAGPGWAGRTAYNRGQILYRLAEMLEGRAEELAGALAVDGAVRKRAALREVEAVCDCLVHYAGWADKFEQVLGSTNPVAGRFFNFTVCEPMGVIAVIAGDAAPLLGLISQVVPAIVSGNTVVAAVSQAHPYAAIVLGEALAVSDLPGGVVNLLTGLREELVPTMATHGQIRGIDAVVTSAEEARAIEAGGAGSIKRVRIREAADIDWLDVEAHESVWPIRDFVEFKTVWHPVGA